MRASDFRSPEPAGLRFHGAPLRGEGLHLLSLIHIFGIERPKLGISVRRFGIDVCKLGIEFMEDYELLPFSSCLLYTSEYPTKTYDTYQNYSECWKLQVGIRYVFN